MKDKTHVMFLMLSLLAKMEKNSFYNRIKINALFSYYHLRSLVLLNETKDTIPLHFCLRMTWGSPPLLLLLRFVILPPACCVIFIMLNNRRLFISAATVWCCGYWTASLDQSNIFGRFGNSFLGRILYGRYFLIFARGGEIWNVKRAFILSTERPQRPTFCG